MFRNRLSFRISMVVALSLLVVELGTALLGFNAQKKVFFDKRKDSLLTVVRLLEGQISRSVRRSQYADLTATLSELAQRFNAHSLTLFDPEGHILVHQQLKDDYQSRVEDLKDQLRTIPDPKNASEQTFKNAAGETTRVIFPIRDGKEKLVAGLSLEAASDAGYPGMLSFLVKRLGLSLLTVLLVTGIVAFTLVHLLDRPLGVMKEELVALSRGEADLTYQIKVTSNDEVGEMARCFNLFIGKIRLMVTRVMEHSHHLTEQVNTMTHSTNEVTAMSDDVTTTIQQIAKGAEEQASKIAEVNHLMQEVQETMKEVEKKAMETSTAVDRATQTARTGGKLAHGTIDRMVELNGVILKNSGMVAKLGNKSQQVGRVVELISGIAEQTNLLSLNAAIEAARAGEQGRGFAVVADEIRTLADGASKATQEITALVSEMQDETRSVAESIEKSASEAQVGKDSIRQMETSLDEIIAVIENVVQHSKSISGLISAQSQRFTKIVHSIQDINAVSEESAASTEEVSASTQEQSASMEQVNATCKELSAMSEELKSMVEKFKIR